MTRIPARIWAALALAALAVRLYRLDHFSYWLDEIIESYNIHRSWEGLWASLRWEAAQAPLDYFLGKLFCGLNPSDALLKLPAVLWGVGTVIAMTDLIGRRVGRAAGWSAGALLVVAPFHVHYSQELRPYSLGMFLLVLSLLLLERFLSGPSVFRLVCVYLACLATAYALYVAALVLGIAAGAMVLEDCFSSDTARSATARRFLLASPVFGAALWAGYLPWWPVFRAALVLTPFTAPPRFTAARIVRYFSFFGFGHADWQPLGPGGVFFVAGATCGAIVAGRRPRSRFLLVWAVGGLAAMEWLERRHGFYDSIFHDLPAGLSLSALFAVGLAAIARRIRIVGLAAALLSVFLSVSSLRAYFESGRPDWRPVGKLLRDSRRPGERIAVDSQWTLLCAAYYVFGPNWLCCGDSRAIVAVRGDVRPLAWLQESGRALWLVSSFAAGGSAEFTRLVEDHAVGRFPRADGAVVGRLPPR